MEAAARRTRRLRFVPGIVCFVVAAAFFVSFGALDSTIKCQYPAPGTTTPNSCAEPPFWLLGLGTVFFLCGAFLVAYILVSNAREAKARRPVGGSRP